MPIGLSGPYPQRLRAAGMAVDPAVLAALEQAAAAEKVRAIPDKPR